jgi:hypothetical protein
MKKFLSSFIIITILIFYGCGEKLTSSQKEVKDVLSDYTNALKKGDFATAYNYVAQVSKDHIALAEFTNTWTKNLTEFEIKRFSVENIAILEFQSKVYATAIMKREYITLADNKNRDQRLDYHLFKESGSWRILRQVELDRKIKAYWQQGEKSKANDLAMICIKIDPLTATSVEEYITQLMTSRQIVTPTPTSQKISKVSKNDISFKIKKKEYDGSNFLIEYSVTNNSQFPIERLSVKAVWQKPDVDEILKERTDYIVSYGDTPLEKGYTKTGELTYWTLKEISKVKADLYISIDDSDWELIKKDILVSIPSVAKDIKFEITKISYDRTLAADFTSHINVGRIDYKITNVSNKPIDRLKVKVVWFKSGTTEVFDETERYLIYSGDIPLKPGSSKSDYITSGTGLRGGYPDLTADIYVSKYYDKYEIVRKGVRIE